MSHAARITTEFKNEESLRAASAALNLPLTDNAKARAYGGQLLPCDLVMTLPGPYDLGFTRERNGTFSLICDNEVMYESDNGRNNQARALLGSKCARLYQEYLAAEASAQGRVEAFSASSFVDTDGSMVVVLRR